VLAFKLGVAWRGIRYWPWRHLWVFINNCHNVQERQAWAAAFWRYSGRRQAPAVAAGWRRLRNGGNNGSRLQPSATVTLERRRWAGGGSRSGSASEFYHELTGLKWEPAQRPWPTSTDWWTFLRIVFWLSVLYDWSGCIFISTWFVKPPF
jgi:hypothetical protein